MKTTIDQFYVIGISIRTTNEKGQAASDIPPLWHKFMSENIASQIPDKKSYAIYCIYTNYESDYTKAYDTVLGCRVENLDNIPDGFVGITIEGGNYEKFTAKGKMSEGFVFQEWTKIWNADADLKRTYRTDYEVYDERSQDFENAVVDIFIGIEKG